MTQATRQQATIVWALAGLIVAAPHLLGGIFAWGTLSLAIAATFLAGTAAWAWSTPPGQQRVELVALMLGLVVLLTVAHALPLPIAIAGFVAPDALEHTSAVHDLLGMTPPRSVPMTLDPGRTHERALYAVAVWATFCAALLVATARRSLVFAAVGLSGLIIALSDLGHLLFDASSVYGLYRPVYTPARGPILNPNNLAGMLAMCTPVCLGLAARAAETRVYWGAAAVITGASCLVANSRGGTAALAAGVLLFAVLVWLGPGGSKRPRVANSSALRRLVIAAIPVVALMTSFLIAQFAADTPLDTNYANLSKLDLLSEELRFLWDVGPRALIGVGRGALPAVFSAARFPMGRVFHAENFLLQYAIDFGVLLGVFIVGVVTVRVFQALLRWHSVAQLGALCGCVAIGLHNLIDFSLELTGIAIPAAACLAAALARKPSTRVRNPVGRAARIRAPSAGDLAWASAAAGTIVVTIFGASALHNDAYVAQLELQQRIRMRSGDDFWPLYRESLLTHPADPGLTMLGASRKVRERKRDAWPWIERTLKLAPSWGAPHVLAAQWLLSQGKQDSAVAALREAAKRDPQLSLRTLCDWLGRARFAEVVLMVVPEQGLQRHTVLDRGAICLAAAPEEAEKVDAVLLREQPEHLGANLRVLRRLLVRHEFAAAATKARALQQLHPHQPEPYQAEARALLSNNQAPQAARVLIAGVQRVEHRVPLLLELVNASARAGDETAMRDAVEQLRGLSGGNPRNLAQALSALSNGESILGNHAQALRAARDAYDLHPDVSYLALAARAAERLGQTTIAHETWSMACREAPSNAAYCKSRDALAKLLQSQAAEIRP